MKKIVFVAEVEEILDQEMYSIYTRHAVEIVEKYNGKYIARSSKIYPVGGKNPKRCVIIGFDSKKDADKCFSSEEYLKIKHLRENSVRTKAFMIENEG